MGCELLRDQQNAPVVTACGDSAETVDVAKAAPALHTLALPVVPIGGQARDAAFLSRGLTPTARSRSGSTGQATVRAPAAGVHHRSERDRQRHLPLIGVRSPADGHYRWVATYSGDAETIPLQQPAGRMARPLWS